MAIAFMPVPSAMVRFLVALRAELLMDLIRAIEPDVREVLLVAECFGLELPTPDLRDRVDAETARFIAEQVLPLPRGAGACAAGVAASGRGCGGGGVRPGGWDEQAVRGGG